MGESQPIHAGERTGGQKKGRKGKIRLGRACKGCSYNPNIAEQNGGVKKKQVKGCGSVNRPTPGSQRPAEPVATGLLQGVKTSKNRGQFSGLGVKLWVIAWVETTNKAQCKAIPLWVGEGVKVWAVAFFGDFCASRGASSFAVRSTVDKSGNYPFFPLHGAVPQRKICTAKQGIDL